MHLTYITFESVRKRKRRVNYNLRLSDEGKEANLGPFKKYEAKTHCKLRKVILPPVRVFAFFFSLRNYSDSPVKLAFWREINPTATKKIRDILAGVRNNPSKNWTAIFVRFDIRGRV